MLDFNKAIEKDSEYANAYYNRGVVKGKMNQFQDAHDDLTKALELNPLHHQALEYRGKMNLFLGNKEDACNDFKSAAEKGNAKAQADLESHCN